MTIVLSRVWKTPIWLIRWCSQLRKIVINEKSFISSNCLYKSYQNWGFAFSKYKFESKINQSHWQHLNSWTFGELKLRSVFFCLFVWEGSRGLRTAGRHLFCFVKTLRRTHVTGRKTQSDMASFLQFFGSRDKVKIFFVFKKTNVYHNFLFSLPFCRISSVILLSFEFEKVWLNCMERIHLGLQGRVNAMCILTLVNPSDLSSR